MNEQDTKPTIEAYAELQQAYDYYNDELFGGQLPGALITFQREKRTFGYFSPGRFVRRVNAKKSDEIAINPEFFALHPLQEACQTLTHEMVHQWQMHYGNPSRTCYHNAEFATKMESIGLMPSSTGMPGGKKTGQKMADYVIPGGPFDIATKKLFATGWAISWLDRFPAPQRPMLSTVVAAVKEELGESVAAALVAVEAQVNATAFAMPVPETLAQELGLVIREEGDRSNRTKYSCPTCPKVNVWGRPGLKIKCGECDSLLE